MFAIEPSRLSRDELRILDARHTYVVSAVSLWEMRTKWQTLYRSGDRKGSADPSIVLAVLDGGGFTYDRLSLTFEHCTASLIEPLAHSDSFDRLLLTQAQVENMRLLTRDTQLEHHPLALFA